MIIPRFILSADVRISPPGVDASTASPDQLLIHLTSQTVQIAMQGVCVGPFPRAVPHALGYAPIVFVNLMSNKLISGFPYVRPFDNTYPPYTNSYVQSQVSQLLFNQTGPLLDVNFTVLTRPRP